jgi:hypothetical protein
VAVVLAAVALQPGGPDLLQTLTDHLQDISWLQDPGSLSALATSPIVVVAALVVVAGIIPIIEEAVKTVGVGLLAYRRPRLSQAFLWGLACGAGFAMAEGLLNTAGGLDAWAFVVTLRVGAALLHTFTGGLMGVAWYYALVERRWPRWLGLYTASVGLHGLWNALAAGVAFISLASGDVEMPYPSSGLAGIGITATLVLLVFLVVSVGLGMVALTRYVRSHSPVLPTLEGKAGPGHPGLPVPEGGFTEDSGPAG